MGDLQHLSGDQRAPAQLRVLRRRHAVVSVGAAAERAGQTADRRHALDVGRRDHVRVRAGHADRTQAGRHSRPGGDASQPRRRELRRPHSRGERAGAPVAGNPPRVSVRAVARLSADQHRSDRRHARRDRRELAAAASRKRSSSHPTASPSTRWSCRSTRRSAATC